MAADKCILAYSGGMDSTISVLWIKENYGLDVITLTVGLGGEQKTDGLRERAKRAGALDSVILDARDEFVEQYIWRGLRAGAMYEDAYALSTALARPLMAKKLVEVARERGAVAVSHGCTGKGNDQVRFDAGVKTLSAIGTPLRIVTPAREWNMTRDEKKSTPIRSGSSWKRSATISASIQLIVTCGDRRLRARTLRIRGTRHRRTPLPGPVLQRTLPIVLRRS